MKSFKKITLVMFSLVLMVGITLVGCSKKESTVSSVTDEPFDLALCFASEPQTIDPTLNTTVDGAVMIQHAFEGLMKWGDAGTPANSEGNVNDAKLVNGQASSYEKTVNEDGTVTYTFKIRPDAKWSDGKRLWRDN